MAAKKSARKKKVTIVIDPNVLRKFASALSALSKLAAAYDAAADDPKLRRELLKKGRKRR